MNEIIRQLNKEAAAFRLGSAQNAEHHAVTLERVAKLLEERGSPPSTDRGLDCLSRVEAECASEARAMNPCIAPPPARTVTTHHVNGLNNAITIEPRGVPGVGGAHQQYVLQLRANANHPASRTLIVDFQSKPITGPDDFDGWTNEALLAVVIDRLRGVQGEEPVHSTANMSASEIATAKRNRAPFSCRENAIALTHLEDAMHWLHARTRDRQQRGVEGKLVR